MSRVMPFAAIVLGSALVLGGCAVNQGNSGGVGASASKSTKVASRKDCKALNKTLKKMERERLAGTKPYEKVLDLYLNKNCYTAET